MSDKWGYMLDGWWRMTPFDSFLLLFTFIRLTSSRTDRTTGESWEPEMGKNSELEPHTNTRIIAHGHAMGPLENSKRCLIK